MRTSRFVDLVERAYTALYAKENRFITVRFDPDPSDGDGEIGDCLGLLVGDGEHMALVGVEAMRLIWADAMPEDGLDQDEIGDLDEEFDDFANLMGTMRVGPYMDWHVAYFPGLTDDPGDRNASEILGLTRNPYDADDLYAEFESLDANPRWYSGRGMMGRECLAIVGSEQELAVAWSTVRERAPEANLPQLDDRASDTLGHDVVWYFPLISKPEGA